MKNPFSNGEAQEPEIIKWDVRLHYIGGPFADFYPMWWVESEGKTIGAIIRASERTWQAWAGDENTGKTLPAYFVKRLDAIAALLKC